MHWGRQPLRNGARSSACANAAHSASAHPCFEHASECHAHVDEHPHLGNAQHARVVRSPTSHAACVAQFGCSRQEEPGGLRATSTQRHCGRYRTIVCCAQRGPPRIAASTALISFAEILTNLTVLRCSLLLLLEVSAAPSTPSPPQTASTPAGNMCSSRQKAPLDCFYKENDACIRASK